MSLKVLVFQHHDAEHPGIFRDFMQAQGVDWMPVNLHNGEMIPALDGFDVLMVMGGPMDVWETAQHPWLVDEKAAIRQWVLENRKPFLGVCLRHQLLAEACGGACGKLSPAEVGICDVTLKDCGSGDLLLTGLPSSFKVLQWHGMQIETLPPEGISLARSQRSDHQVIRVGNRAWGIQYHVELTDTTIAEWGLIPEYRSALDGALGPDSLPDFMVDADANMADFRQNAERLFDNFIQVGRESLQ